MTTSASGLCPGVCRGEVVSSRSRMYKACDELESVRISGQWKPLMVNAPNPVISRLHGKLYCAIATEGDGACAVHSLLGEPCAYRNNNLYAAQARATVVSAFGATAATFQNRLHNDILYTAVTSALWRDCLYPILAQNIDGKNGQEITNCGRILWELVSEEERLQEKLVAFCIEEMRRDVSNATQSERAFHSFELVCIPAYDGFLTVLAQLLGWDTEESPGIMEFGQERVKGTQEQMPESDKPTTKLQALLDKRPCFSDKPTTKLQVLLDKRPCFAAILTNTCSSMASIMV